MCWCRDRRQTWAARDHISNFPWLCSDTEPRVSELSRDSINHTPVALLTPANAGHWSGVYGHETLEPNLLLLPGPGCQAKLNPSQAVLSGDWGAGMMSLEASRCHGSGLRENSWEIRSRRDAGGTVTLHGLCQVSAPPQLV